MGMFDKVKEKISRYVDVHVRLFKVNFIGRTANLLSYFMFALISLFILFCIILFLGLGLTEAFMLAGMSKMVSFFLTIGVYLIFLFTVVMLRTNITDAFSGIFIRLLTESDDDDKKKDDDSDDEDA